VVRAGFADSTVIREANLALSTNCAAAAARALKKEKIGVQDTVGFAQELPIRDHGTQDAKKTRIEFSSCDNVR
jgi:outer membrane protein OmpA-like peptidoglycan-associated protein